MVFVKVAIIGCGPAGLFAAHACAQSGLEFDILAPKKMSPLGGAQYLHQEIPALSESKPSSVSFRKIGTRDGYALKVYGNMAMEVSWDKFDEGTVPCWSLQNAYIRGWIRYSDNILGTTVAPEDIKKLKKKYDLLINTAPKRMLCLHPDEDGHDFTWQQVFITQPEMRQGGAVANQIVYNGQREVDWYRWSMIQGASCYEYSHKPAFKKKEFHEVRKPLRNFCDCHASDAYLEVGRYGRWAKGALTHEAYYNTMEAISAL